MTGSETTVQSRVSSTRTTGKALLWIALSPYLVLVASFAIVLMGDGRDGRSADVFLHILVFCFWGFPVALILFVAGLVCLLRNRSSGLRFLP